MDVECGGETPNDITWYRSLIPISINIYSYMDIQIYSKTKITSVGKNNLPTQPNG